MNICPTVRPLPRVRQGVLTDDGLGAMFRPKSPRRLLKRHRRLAGRLLRAPLRVRGGQLAGLYGSDYDGPGLGKLRLGKKLKRIGKGLKKVVKSKLFKYAAIATAAYFTGGAALPLLKKIGAKKLLDRGSRQSVADAIQTYQAAGAVPMVPGSEADTSSYYPAGAAQGGGYGYGGGGDYGGGYQAAGFAPGMTDEQEITESEARAAGAGQAGSNLLPALAIGIPLFLMLAGGSGARGRRR